MRDFKSNIHLRKIARHDKDTISTAIDILAEAFSGDPLMNYFTSGLPTLNTDALRRKIIRALVTSHIASGEPLYGLFQDDHLLGCATVDARLDGWRKVLGLLRCVHLWLALPISTIRKLNDYGAISKSGNPKEATHFLVMLGMATEARGKGYGGWFLRAVEAEYDPKVHWILDTENPTNIALYNHMGYEVYDEVAIRDFFIYKMQKSL